MGVYKLYMLSESDIIDDVITLFVIINDDTVVGIRSMLFSLRRRSKKKNSSLTVSNSVYFQSIVGYRS